MTRSDLVLVRTEYAPSDSKVYNNVFYGEMQITGGSTASPPFIADAIKPARRRAPCRCRRSQPWQVPAESTPRTACSRTPPATRHLW